MEGGQDGPLGRAGEGKEGVWLAEESGVEEEKRKVRYLPALRAHQGGWYIQLERGE
jgi:hypothetical protein